MKKFSTTFFSLLMILIMLFQFTGVDATIQNNQTDYLITDQVRYDEPGTTSRVSVASDGTQGNGWSNYKSISADGRYVAFSSNSNNLVPGDTNNAFDVFVHDRQTGQTTRVSVATDGTQGNDSSSEPSISANGRYVAFISRSDNLTPVNMNDDSGVFVHDRQTGQTTGLEYGSELPHRYGSKPPIISADGRYVAFSSLSLDQDPYFPNYEWFVFVHDRQTGETTTVSVASDGTLGNGASYITSISADGRYVAFWSHANNLVPGDTNNTADVFVHDRQTGKTTRVSVTSNGIQGNDWSGAPSISADGRYVAFWSDASNLVQGDTNNYSDIFVHDRQTGETTRISVTLAGSQGNNDSYDQSISADGRYVAYRTHANNLVSGDTNNSPKILVHDRQTGQTILVSVASDGTQGNGWSETPSISADGRYVAFTSDASNLVPGDTNDLSDIFVHHVNWEGSVEPPEPDDVDIGFRPFPHGYSFPNYRGVQINDFTFNDMRELFGDDAVCVTTFPTCQFRFGALYWWGKLNNLLMGAKCDAFAVTSLRLFVPDYETPSDFNPLAESTFDLQKSSKVRRYIAFNYAKVVTDPVITERVVRLSKTPSETLFDLKKSMTSFPRDPMTLIVYKIEDNGNVSGHTITPYKIEEVNNGIFYVWVYDNNSEGDDSRYVIINTNYDSWEYDMGDEMGIFAGDAASKTLSSLPISIYEQQPQCPWCGSLLRSESFFQIWFQGDGSLLIENKSGDMLGYFDNQFFEEIESGYVAVIDGGMGDSPQLIYVLPIGDYNMTITGDEHEDLGLASITQFGPDQVVNFDNIPVSGYHATNLYLDSSGKMVEISSSHDIIDIDIGLVSEMQTTSKLLSLENIEILMNDKLLVELKNQEQKLIVDGSKNSGGFYDFIMKHSSENGTFNFVHRDIELTTNATHYISFNSWDGVSDIMIEIDLDSNGIIDETIWLPNQSSTQNMLFLPLITR